MHLLVIEDERALCETIVRSLRRLAYSCLLYTSGQHQRQQQCDDFLHVHFLSSVFNVFAGFTGSFLPSPKP